MAIVTYKYATKITGESPHRKRYLKKYSTDSSMIETMFETKTQKEILREIKTRWWNQSATIYLRRHRAYAPSMATVKCGGIPGENHLNPGVLL